MDEHRNINQKWRKQLYYTCLLLAVIGVIAEVVIYSYDVNHSDLFLPNSEYRFRFIYLPSMSNAIVLVVTYLCLRSKRLSNMAKNACACSLIYFLCANIQVTHYVYGPILVLPVIAIFVTTLFYNRKLTAGIFVASLISTGIAYCLATQELRKGDKQLPSDIYLSLLIIMLSFITTNLLINYTSEQMNYIIESNARQKKLIEDCNMDPLLGIGNRRALSKEWNSLQSGSLPADLYLVLIDVDDFKEINDQYGHLAGDEVLMALAELIKKRTYDKSITAYRYGGEEIILIFKNIAINRVYWEVENIRKEFWDLNYSFSNKKKISVSSGIASYDYTIAKEENWIKNADDALHIAKADGMNRTLVYTEDLPCDHAEESI